MSPSQLVELAEAKDFIKAREFREALKILLLLQQNDPHDPEITGLINLCNFELGIKPHLQTNYTPQPTPLQQQPSIVVQPPMQKEIIIRFKDPALFALVSFIVIVCSIIAAWYIIFYMFNFTLVFSR